MQINPSIIPINFNQKSIFIVNEELDILPSLKGKSSWIVFQQTEQSLRELINRMQHDEVESIVLVGNQIAIIDLFKKTFLFVRAGGGLVENLNNELLCIFRRGKWDLPKGKLDEGETIEECALREVNEETGAEQLQIDHLICKTYHLYYQEELIFKQTDWFSMKSSSILLNPQAEEGIDEAIWIRKKDLETIVINTYDSIKTVLKNGKWL